MLRGKGPHTTEFVYEFSRLHSLLIHTDLNEYVTVATRRLLCCVFSFFSKLKAGDIITTGQWMNYQTINNLQFRPLLKNCFHRVQIDLENTSGEQIPFVSVGINRLVLLLRKASNIHFLPKRRYKMVASKQVETLQSYWSTTWTGIRFTCTS